MSENKLKCPECGSLDISIDSTIDCNRYFEDWKDYADHLDEGGNCKGVKINE